MDDPSWDDVKRSATVAAVWGVMVVGAIATGLIMALREMCGG